MKLSFLACFQVISNSEGADQLRSIEVNIEDEDVYMVLLMSVPPSFDNLVMSLESMSTKDVDLEFIVARLLHEVSKKKKVKVKRK